ncbi:hypothetical protein [Novosphingobium rosa]|uniref:hypothetical protein n=1 Tax=Novosphingobium rosa TaxID=76978 RepID=UPI00082FA45F|nr:hypothetical protein [Novosphingobium rosa]
MYTGHLAAGLLIKSYAPKVKCWPILLGVGWLDILDGLFIVLGANLVTPDLKSGPYLFFDLTFIDWDHSLLMAAFWSAAWGALFWRNRMTAVLAGLASFSHFLLDWPMHNFDLALFPHSSEHIGYGLWGKWGTWSWVAEGLFDVLLLVIARRNFAARRVSLTWPLVVMTVAFFNLSPWLSPMKHVATLPEPATHILHGILVTSGFLLPGLLLSWLVDRAQSTSAASNPTA